MRSRALPAALLPAALLLAAAACSHRPAVPPAPAVASVPATPAPAAEAPVKNPHDHGGKPACSRCHEPGATTVRKDPIALCAECHDASRMKHPFRVVQRPAPEGLPVMAGDLVACHTCHDPHGPAKRASALRLEYSALCLRCHVKHGNGGGGRAPHPIPGAGHPAPAGGHAAPAGGHGAGHP